MALILPRDIVMPSCDEVLVNDKPQLFWQIEKADRLRHRIYGETQLWKVVVRSHVFNASQMGKSASSVESNTMVLMTEEFVSAGLMFAVRNGS